MGLIVEIIGLVVFLGAHVFVSMRDERAFLARAAWRVAVDRRPRVDSVEPPLELRSGGVSPEQAAINEDWNGVVHRLIDALPEELRQPLVLSALDELNSREVAEALGIPEGTVRTRLMRARQMLKQRLAGLMGRFG